MHCLFTRATIVVFAAALAACTTVDSDATRLVSPTSSSRTVTPPWGPETPKFNLEVVLRGDPDGFGLVKFRQPNDADRIVNLDVWVRDLLPNGHYRLQRATDTNVNDDCTGTNWLTLGRLMIDWSMLPCSEAIWDTSWAKLPPSQAWVTWAGMYFRSVVSIFSDDRGEFVWKIP